jgi:hypothetical protein
MKKVFAICFAGDLDCWRAGRARFGEVSPWLVIEL